MRSPIARLSVLVLVLAGGGWWWKHKQAAEPNAADAAKAAAPAASGASGAAGKGGPQAVGVLKALLQDVPVTLEASGTVTALRNVDLRAQTTSTVREVLLKDGDAVRQGQVLLRFDDRADRANLDKARAQLARSKAQLGDLERQYRRAQELRAQNFVAQNAVDTALTNLEAQRAQLLSDEAALQSASVALSYNELRAPLAGRVGTVNVVAGSLVQASAAATPLLGIAQINPIGVSFSLPETQLAPLLAATHGSKQKDDVLEAQVLMPGARGARGAAAEVPVKGRVNFVDNQVDPSTGTIKVRAEFENQKETLWPGQYVRVRLTLRTIKDAVVVPQAALILRGNERSIYIVGADKTAQLKPVQLRYPFGEMAVVEGIAAGDTVVVDGKQHLRPGTPVKEQPAAVNPAAAPAKRASEASAPAAAAASGAKT
ncbi:efflux RND transporter periplasmic adaptor subunit [Paucibacter sp. APW11]|uniref:Efflux RND transporter periplasmic adaptor subunit n=1 Tax=Roseateles aquae TaxID=3077235 RepID=A0ABU3PBK6_9BURK|nr:efflux RND transporter periplasmic adaptor subunit [Paucibacter sp. APW11]MDT8999948.1 efflux RND transporter periplasmic adaptor subunit [Paucibacter sp. APW11]